MAKARPHSERSSHRHHLLLAVALLSSVLLLPAAMASAAVAVAAEGDGENRSRGAATQWATGKDEGELAAEREAAGEGSVVEDDFAGGFGSLDSMLQWAIGNSDPGRLKEEAADVQKLSEDELLKRRHEIKDLMEKLKMPSDADLMKIAIADLNNASISLEDRQRALQELLILVEPIDNASDLDKIGGLVPVIQDLNNANEEIRTTSAWILGTASQNNALVQSQILGYGALARLVKMGYSTSAEEAAKAMYAISALIRNNINGQEAFNSENGNAMLQHILGSNSVDVRLQKKAVFLITDLADLMEKLKMPSDADLMKIAIADLNNASISLEDRLRALQELLILVEPIDNANDLDKIEGLVPVIQDLNNANEEIRTTSAWILGTASQNNALVQSQILGYGALARLVKMGYSTSAKEAAKAMYAISALIRNNVNGQEAFNSENGNAMLQHILGSNRVDLRLQKKAVFLITDLADFQLNSGNSGLTFLSERDLLKSVTDMLSKFDLDLQEKVLLAIRSLLKLPSTDPTDFESCGLDSVLYRLGVQLEELPSEEQKEYAGEVDALRREVQTLFQQKQLKPGTAAAAL